MKKKLLSVLLMAYALSASAYMIRNTYPERLICIQAEKPHARYELSAHLSKSFEEIPSRKIRAAGYYKCYTADRIYTSTCQVSDLQPIATFDTNDGAASCTTPVRIKRRSLK